MMQFALAMAVLLLNAATINGCRCFQTSIESEYFKSATDRFVSATVVLRLKSSPTRNLYLFKVNKVYKGCPLDYFLATSAKSSAACGIIFKKRKSYVMPLPKTLYPWPNLNSCQFIRRTKFLTAAERDFLNNRNVCCGKECECANGKPPVNCLVSPCAPTPVICKKSPCPFTPKCPLSTTCRDNYCGGCNFDCVPRTPLVAGPQKFKALS